MYAYKKNSLLAYIFFLLNCRYAKTLAYHPSIVLAVVAVFSSICLIVPFVTQKLPSFTDPTLVCILLCTLYCTLSEEAARNATLFNFLTKCLCECENFALFFTKGFETRGTTISQRITAWQNLAESLRPSGSLTANPSELLLMSSYEKSTEKYTVVNVSTLSPDDLLIGDTKVRVCVICFFPLFKLSFYFIYLQQTLIQ